MSKVSDAYAPPRDQPDPDHPGAAGPPTVIRFAVLTSLCILAFILYIDRICISRAVISIEQDLGITHSQMALVLASFTVAYSLFEVPMGWWGDRFGSRGVLTRIVVWWSVFTALTGAALGFYSLLTIRFLFGAGEAGALPNTARILACWFPVERRGFAQGMINTSALVGGAVAPIAATFLIQTAGWRWAFLIFSIPGFVWAAFFYWWYRDDPAEHAQVNAAERELIARGTIRRAHGEAHPPIPWRLVLRSGNIWLMGGVLACSAFNSYFYFTWYPTFLEEGRGLSENATGIIASLVLFAGAFGTLTGGWLADWLIRHSSSKRWARSSLGFCSMGGSALLLLAGGKMPSPMLSAVCTAAAVLLAFITLPSWWGAVADVSGRHLGALFGLMNSVGGLGAIASQLFVGNFVDWMVARGFSKQDAWDPLFFIYAGVLFTGAVGWLLINVERSVDEAETPLALQSDSSESSAEAQH